MGFVRKVTEALPGTKQDVGNITSALPGTREDVTKLRDAAETAAVLAGNYYLPGSSMLTSKLVSQKSQGQLGSDLGMLAQLGTGGAGMWNGNLSNWNPGNWGGGGGVGGDPLLGTGYEGGMSMPGAGTDLSPYTSPYNVGGGGGVGGGTGGGWGGGVGGGEAGGGGMSTLEMLGQGLNLTTGLYGLFGPGPSGDGSPADPFAPYRGQAAQQLMALQANPSLLTQRPGYQAGLEAVQRSMAAQGYQGSGNMMTALADYGGNAYDQEMQRLMTMSGASTSPTAGAEIEQQRERDSYLNRIEALNRISGTLVDWGSPGGRYS